MIVTSKVYIYDMSNWRINEKTEKTETEFLKLKKLKSSLEAEELYSNFYDVNKLFLVRDDTHMTSMKIVQFS